MAVSVIIPGVMVDPFTITGISLFSLMLSFPQGPDRKYGGIGNQQALARLLHSGLRLQHSRQRDRLLLSQASRNHAIVSGENRRVPACMPERPA